MSNVPGTQPGATGAFGVPPGGWGTIEPTDNEAIAKLLAESNPFRFTVSVPVMILELTEAASLLEIATKGVLAEIAGGFLNWKFGWLATMQDIKTLSTITTAIENRVKEFNALISSGGSRRRVFISKRKVSVSQENETFFSSGYGSWGGDSQVSYSSKVWGSCTWRPQRDKLVEVEALATFNQAVRSVLDLEFPDPSTVWQAIPFSWLIDYFTNIGTELAAVEHNDLVIADNICIMRERHIDVVSKWRLTDSFGEPRRTYHGESGEVNIVMKNRTIHEMPYEGDLLKFGFMNRAQAITLIALLASFSRR